MEFDGEKLFRCPNRPYLDTPNFFDEIFFNYEYSDKWGFPEKGSWQDQPNALFDCFVVIDQAKKDAEDHIREQDRKKQALAEKVNRRIGAKNGSRR